MQEYHIHNLDCPDCASKLERDLNKLDYVKKLKSISALVSCFWIRAILKKLRLLSSKMNRI